ncbi:hypothetical protein M404DRAFT_31970, partial [Pisolithus tinctorius Marx 270]
MDSEQSKKHPFSPADPSTSDPPSVGRSFISVGGICRLTHFFAMSGKQSKKPCTTDTNRPNFDPSSGPSQITAGHIPSHTQASGS